MNGPRGGPTNLATDSAMVAVQAEAFHGDVIYQVGVVPSPLETFEVGLRSLRGGMAPQAREHIRDAVVNGYVNGRSCFYLLLALLSGRTPQQVPPEELTMLHSVRDAIKDGDEWADAIRLIDDLMTSQDPLDIEQELKELAPIQRDDILQHLEMFLHSSVKDDLWARAFDAARNDRCKGDRLDRAWKFFQPRPIGARVRPTRPVTIELGTRIGATATTALALGSVGFVGVAAWQHTWSATVPALLAFAVGCYASVRSGVEWRFRKERRQAKDREYLGRSIATARGGGFAAKIDQQFNRYFALYTPRGADKARWIAETAGVRRALHDEVITIYRESTVNAERVAWLVRYLVSDVARRWQAGTLWDYRNELRVPVSMKAICVLGAVAAALGGILLAWNGAHVRPLTVPMAALVALAAVWLAARGWLRIAVEHRRHAADDAEGKHLLANRQAALDRWKCKLADRPDDLEMAHWLECDRKALMEEAMRLYKLKRQDVLAHAFIEAPATPSYKRARVRKGPWRYSRYKILTFLLTKDGVRQLTVDLDFEQATFHNRERTNYRYDAFTSVQVAEANGGQITFKLTLTNGAPISVKVTDPPSEFTEDEDPRSASPATLDTAGLGNALHVLEGVAAEGKEWINFERQREQAPLADLSEAIDAIFTSN